MSNKIGWLVNDCLTCIPDTKTFWHFLLSFVDGLEDKTGGYTDFRVLPKIIEELYAKTEEKPKYVVRNATFFRNLAIPVKTISLLQDPYSQGTRLFNMQIEVCNTSDVVVFNSKYTFELYNKFISKNVKRVIIPIGTDSVLFNNKGCIKNKKTIVYVGSSNEEFKGFSMVKELINKTNYNFNLVMKDGFSISHPRVKVYNKISQERLSDILNHSDILVCPSKKETLHLAGIEAAFCGTPVVAAAVGVYPSLVGKYKWGEIIEDYSVEGYLAKVKQVILNYDDYQPRESMFYNQLDKESCGKRWVNIIKQLS